MVIGSGFSITTQKMSPTLNPLVRVDANDFPGYYRTIVEFPIYSLKNKSEECIGYWIAYIRNKKKILSKNCIRPKKQWMFDSRFVGTSIYI